MPQLRYIPDSCPYLNMLVKFLVFIWSNMKHTSFWLNTFLNAIWLSDMAGLDDDALFYQYPIK